MSRSNPFSPPLIIVRPYFTDRPLYYFHLSPTEKRKHFGLINLNFQTLSYERYCTIAHICPDPSVTIQTIEAIFCSSQNAELPLQTMQWYADVLERPLYTSHDPVVIMLRCENTP